LNITEAALRTGVSNRVALNRRYVPLVSELKSLLKAQYGSEGKAAESIHNLRCDFHRVNRLDADFSTTAIHGIDAVSHIAGSRYKEVYFRYQEFPELGPNVTNIFMDCCFESGATAQLSFCPVTGAAFEHITVNTLGKTYILKMPILGTEDFPGSLTVYEENRQSLRIDGKEFSGTDEMFVLSGFYDENASFFDAIKSGARPSGNVASSLQSVEIADCIRKRKGSWKTLINDK
jgi:predicted dehydrogenase